MHRIERNDENKLKQTLLVLSFDASISSTVAFPPLGNSDHVVPVSSDFPSNSKQDIWFPCIAYDYSRAD